MSQQYYYDWLALQLSHQTKLLTANWPKTAMTHALKVHPCLNSLTQYDKPIEVWSAFGGVALYKMDILSQCLDGYYPQDGWYEHKGLHNQIRLLGEKIWIYPPLHTIWHNNVDIK